MYNKIFNTIAKIFGLKVEVVILRKPLGAEYWVYSKTQDFVHQIYVTNYVKNKENSAFGFWVYDESLLKAYKKALKQVVPNLVWTKKVRLKKWLKVK